MDGSESLEHKNDVPKPAVTDTSAQAPAVEDSDPEFDDLDDVLDQFSANAPVSQSASQSKPVTETPSIPKPATDEKHDDVPLQAPEGQKPEETEEEFVARLSAEMSKMMSTLGADQTSTQTPKDMSKIGRELEEFTYQMEKQGIKPEDLLRAVLGDEAAAKMAEAAVGNEDQPVQSKQEGKQSTSKSASTTTAGAGPSSFDDTIRRTMSRLNESDTQATTASQQSASKSEEDILAELLKSLDGGGGLGAGAEDPDGLSKMFLDMMHQLTHKSMLYEPMKELHTQYPDWLEKNKPPKLKQSEWDRYKRQSDIVRDIVNKFEEPNFSDDDEKCREYVWGKMQDMQGEGAPPEDLVKNPIPGTDFGSIPGLGGGGGGPGDDDGCPTQ